MQCKTYRKGWIMSSKLSLRFLSALLAFIGIQWSAQAIVTVVIEDGETHSIGQSGATQDGGNGGGLWDIRAGGTLCITNSAGGTIWNPVIATNGVATLDATDSTTLNFERGIRCGEKGELTIKAPGRSGYSHTVAFSRSINTVVDIRGLQMVTADGTKDPNGKVLFEHGNCIVHTPTNVAWTISKNQNQGATDLPSDIHFYGPRVVTEANAVIAVETSVKLTVGQPDSIGEDQSVRVKNAGLLVVRPFSAKISEVNVATYAYDVPPLSCGFAVNLATATSVLQLQNVSDWTGSVTGPGTVEVVAPEGAGISSALESKVVVKAGATLSVGATAQIGRIELEAGAALDVAGTVGEIVAVGADTRTVLASGATVGSFAAPGNLKAVLKVLSGARVTVSGSGNEVLLENQGGEVTFSDGAQSWRNAVSLWFDPSRTETLQYVGCLAEDEEYRHPGETVAGYPIYEAVLDWRNAGAAYCLFNNRVYSSDHHFGNNLYPTLEPYGTSETLKFLSLVRSGTRRLPIGKPGVTDANYSIAPKMVMMVFGSQGGGGQAVIGTEDGSFGRTGKAWTDGITTNTAHDIWVNGEKLADPTAPNTLNKGWQILTIDTEGLQVNAFGWVKEYSTSGGQNYGEILIFMDEVSELTQLQAEIYLADKWGLPYPDASRVRCRELLQAAQSNDVFFTGAGDYAFSNGTVVASGKLSGTVTLENARLEVGGALPPTEADVPADENLLGWFDPDDRASLHLYGDFGFSEKDVNDPNRGATGIRAVTDRRDGGFVDKKLMLVGVSARMPYAKVGSHDGGPVRTWIDFANLNAGDPNGNNLRVSPYAEGMDFRDLGSAELVPYSVRTGFVVSDSCRGGGSPVLSAVNGLGDFNARSVNALSTDPIWGDKTVDKVKDGLTRLNGETVRQENGFTGHAEVLTFQPTSAASVGVMGNYATGQVPGGGTSFEWLGEMLFYSTALEAADIELVEAYLMYKWLGRVNYGYRDLRGMTVAGSGRIVSPDVASLPKVDAAFSGAVEVTDAAVFEITIDPETDTVTGGLSGEGVTLDLPDEVTLKVRFTSRPRRGMAGRLWTLFDCAGTANPVTWKLQLEGEKLQSDFELQAEGGIVRLALPAQGIMLLVR